MKIHKKFFTSTIIGLWLLCCMAGCSRQDTKLPNSSADINLLPQTATTEEIPIDFPFFESEPYTLTLALTQESLHEYELRLYHNTGRILQQIPCGTLTEPIQFSYDALIYGTIFHNLEIFPADGSTGLFFQWEGDRFSENVAEIPKYVESRGTSMLTVEDTDTSQMKKLYCFNQFYNRADEVLRWHLQKDTRELEIWDFFEGKSLFKGIVPLNENGDPINQAYYNMLLWDNQRLLWNYLEENTIKTWIDEIRVESTESSQEIEPFEYVQNTLFGNNGHTEEYESKEALLASFGFEESVPLYQYYDQYHNLQLELYQNKTSGQFCGITYQYYFNSDLEKMKTMYGFIINTVSKSKWTGTDPFSTKSIHGTDGASDVKNYSETLTSTPDQKPIHFRSEGIIEDRRTEDGSHEAEFIVEIKFVYRDDGTLYYRDYSHNSYLFGTTLLSLDSYYDEYGRVQYERGYITHGTLEYYYIYGDNDEPIYCLQLDYNGGYAIPSIIQYQ